MNCLQNSLNLHVFNPFLYVASHLGQLRDEHERAYVVGMLWIDKIILLAIITKSGRKIGIDNHLLHMMAVSWPNHLMHQSKGGLTKRVFPITLQHI